MRSPLRMAVAAVLLGTLSACVYIDGERVDSSDWRDEQRENRVGISDLAIGMERAQVVAKLGAPADSEAFTREGEEVRVLFYRTQHKRSDGETTRDETTPLVFENDRLVGWGSSVYEDLRR